MYNKILIANRGEIAVRIIRACKELGIKTVADYSDADKNSLHVNLSDESYNIGKPLPSQSYLVGDNILKVAKKAKCDAIHPGYGFLSENYHFAEIVTKHKIKFNNPFRKTFTKEMCWNELPKELQEKVWWCRSHDGELCSECFQCTEMKKFKEIK